MRLRTVILILSLASVGCAIRAAPPVSQVQIRPDPAKVQVTATSPRVDLAWQDTINPPFYAGTTYLRYNLYRASGPCPGVNPQKITSLLTALVYSDTLVVAGATYCYWATADVSLANAFCATLSCPNASLPTYCVCPTSSNPPSESLPSNTAAAVIPSTPGCLTSTAAWQSTAIPSQTGTFEVTYDDTPGGNLMDGVTGFSFAPAAAYTDLAAITRFNNLGFIDVMNHTAYQAQNKVAYSSGVLYHFRLQINIPSHTYNAFVTPSGATQQITLATGYAFRDPQAAVTSLNDWNFIGGTASHTVCNVQIKSAPITGLQITVN